MLLNIDVKMHMSNTAPSTCLMPESVFDSAEEAPWRTFILLLCYSFVVSPHHFVPFLVCFNCTWCCDLVAFRLEKVTSHLAAAVRLLSSSVSFVRKRPAVCFTATCADEYS